MSPKEHVLTVVKDDLLNAVKWVAKLTRVADHSLISCSVSKNALVMESYNGTVSSKSRCPVTQKTDEEYRFSVNGTLLSNALKNVKSEKISLNFTERTLKIEAGPFRFALPVTVPRTAPELPEFPQVVGQVEAEIFRKMVQHVVSMTSDDPTSPPALTSVHLQLNFADSIITLVGTDRYKFAIRSVPLSVAPEGKELGVDVLDLDLSAALVKTLLADLADDPYLNLYATKNERSGQFGLATSTQKGAMVLRDVQYVNYERLMELVPTSTVTTTRKALLEAVNATKLMIEGSVKTASLVINNDEIVLSAPLSTIGIEIVNADVSEEVTISMNLDYLSSLLSAGSSEYIQLGITGARKPFLVSEMTDDSTVNKNFFNLAMPLSR